MIMHRIKFELSVNPPEMAFLGHTTFVQQYKLKCASKNVNYLYM